MNDYYVQTVCVDEGDDWWTIAAYEDVEPAVAVAKHLLVRDSLTDQALRKTIVCDCEEMGRTRTTLTSRRWSFPRSSRSYGSTSTE